jgi:hypothetical protein
MKTKDDDKGVQGSDPSPVVLRLVKAPEADTLSPWERAESTSAPPLTICRNEAGMSMKTKNQPKAGNPKHVILNVAKDLSSSCGCTTQAKLPGSFAPTEPGLRSE